MIKQAFIPLLLILLFYAALNFAQVNSKPEHIEGFWVADISENGGKQVFVLQLVRDMNDQLHGYIHSYDNGIKLESMETGKAKYAAPRIDITLNPSANVVYSGKIDFNKMIMNGKLIYSNGASRGLDFVFYNENKIKREFPGLININKHFTYEKPAELNDGIKTSTPGTENFSIEVIDTIMKKVYNKDLGDLHSILISKNGKLILEDYFDGYTGLDLHSLKSATKSISSLLIGIAIDKGYIKSIDQKIPDFFPGYSGIINADWKNITLRNILTMSAGLDWTEGLDEKVHKESDDIIRDVLKRGIKNKPGEVFNYVSVNMQLIAGIIKNTTGLKADEFAGKYLFGPLGIKKYDWNYNRQNGNPLMTGALALKPRDMLKIGLLVKDKGVFNGRRIVSEGWIEQSTKSQINVDNIFDYGFLWWIGKSQTAPGLNIIIANGWGSQFIIILPEYDIVVVTTGANNEMEKHFLPLKMFDTYIVKELITKKE